MSLDEKFRKAAEDVRKFSKRPTDQEILQLYGLYKQATVGDCNIDKPSTDSKSKAKWDAWNACKGIKNAKAKEDYISKANSLSGTYA